MATSSAANQPKPDAAARGIQKAVDTAEGRGHYGTKTDPTPAAHYTVAGVTSGAPTPETDADAAARADAAQRGTQQ